MQSHDRFFRHVFSDPQNAAGELRALLPAEITARIDWSALRLVAGTFVEPALAERRTDLLFTAMLSGKPAYLYLLIEHQSRAEHFMALRMLGYMVRIWEQHRIEHPDARQLPPIVGTVVAHDKDGWSAPRSFTDLLDIDAEVLASLRHHLVSFDYFVDDLSAVSEDELRARAMTAFAKISLLCLQRARTAANMATELSRWLSTLRDVLDAPNGRAALLTILRYILMVSDTPPERLRELTYALGPKAEEAYMTGEQVLLERGRAEGEAKGKAEGKAEGLLRVLDARKLAVSDAQRVRILACTDLALLDQWLERAVTSASSPTSSPNDISVSNVALREGKARLLRTPSAPKRQPHPQQDLTPPGGRDVTSLAPPSAPSRTCAPAHLWSRPLPPFGLSTTNNEATAGPAHTRAGAERRARVGAGRRRETPGGWAQENKGNPIKQYEPFFSATSAYEDEEAMAEIGVTSVVTYDALSRPKRVDHPDGSFETSFWTL